MFRWILISTLMLAGQADLSASTQHVCKSCPVSSIKAAIALAKPCDTVYVEPGLYREGNILIDKELVLIGIGQPVLDGEGKTEIVTIAANHVHFEGFVLRNVGISYSEDRAAIRLREVSDFCVKGNRVENAYFGIYLQKSKNGTIEGNEIVGEAKDEVNSGNAIHLWYCDKVLIINNKTIGHRDGIYLEFVNFSTVQGNHSERNVRYGLHFMFSNDDVYRANTFHDNGAGVAVMYSRRIGMFGNHFDKNWGQAAYGLLLKEIHDGQIEGNIFQENTVGIFAETSNRIVYTKNHFVQNGWALKISGGCQQNNLAANHFIGNSFDLAVHSAGTDNQFDGNFWSDYTGYDLDHNGIGDVPHRPMKLFSYVVATTPESLVLLRSLFVDILNFSEKVSPIFTPANVVDHAPLMSPQSAVGSPQSAVGSPQSAVRSRQSADSSRQSAVTSHQSPVTSHRSPITNHQSPTQ